MNKRVLVVAYQFPPVGGAGVQRISKLVKYLPSYGWDVSVLTVKNPSVPTNDLSLLKDIPSDTIICKAKTYEPGYQLKKNITHSDHKKNDIGLTSRFFSLLKRLTRNCALNALQPDPQILWVKEAIKKGKQLLKEHVHDAILVTGPPFSSFFVGTKLKELSGLPLVLDYRDEWSLSNKYWENKTENVWTKYCQNLMQNSVLGKADAITATTRLTVKQLEEKLTVIGKSIPTQCIYNGFDHEDFVENSDSAKNSGKFKLTYVGTLWKLTSPRPLVDALRMIHKINPNLLKKLELEIVGRITPEEFECIREVEKLSCEVILKDYVDHSEAISIMQHSDLLCLLLSDLPGAERVIPAKIFEYLASQSNILAIAPAGELTSILSDYQDVNCIHPESINQIASVISQSINSIQSSSQRALKDLSRFRRDALANQMAEILYALPLKSATDESHSDPLVTSSPRTQLC